MAKPTKRPSRTLAASATGGELHQTTNTAANTLTTNQGIPVSDDQNSLKSGARGPVLLEDFVLREKITHFDHERIPRADRPCPRIGGARLLRGGARREQVQQGGLPAARQAHQGVRPLLDRGRWRRIGRHTARRARLRVKFYTEDGNFDLVGNNIPVFFIQDAMKFPDLVHAVKMEPDRGYPQAASAHDTFWDFISLMPESMNMVMWIMSDRTIPYSLRHIEGFGVHTFRLINAAGESTFVKFTGGRASARCRRCGTRP
jgi:catalase